MDVFTATSALTTPSDEMPDGVFLLPICATKEQIAYLLESLYWYSLTFGESRFDAQQLILEALAFIDNPGDSTCFPESSCDDDVLEDTISQLANGIISNTFEGNVSFTSLGAILDSGAKLITETVLPLIGITLLGGAIAGLLSLFVGGALVETLAIGAGEVLHLTVETGALAGAAKSVMLLAA